MTTANGHDPSTGELPDGWNESTIGKECSVVSGATPKTSVSEFWEGGIAWLTPDDLSKTSARYVSAGRRSLTEAGYDSCSARLVPAGSVLFTSRAPIGYVAIAAQEICTNQGFKTAVPSSSLISEFLYWQLQWATPDIQARASGTTFKEINGEGFAATRIVVPPSREQEQIVELLEAHLSRLDAVLEHIQTLRGKAAQFRRSLLHAAFTGVLTGHDPSTGELPAGWKWASLGEAATVVMGQSPPGSSYNGDGIGEPFFQGKKEFGDLHPTVHKWTTAGKKFANAGDVLMSVRAPVGSTNIADIDCVIGRGLAAIRAGASLGQAFLFWNLRAFESEIAAKGTGTTFDSISGDALRGQLLLVPPLAEQEQIVEILEAHLSRLDAALASVDAIKHRAQALRRSLLHTAFTGKLTEKWREQAHV